MKMIIKLLGVFIILAGVSLLIDPDIIYDWAVGNIHNTSLYIAAIVGRLVFGLMLLIAAKASRFPRAIKFFGYLAILAAVIFILIGHQSFQDFLASIMTSLKDFSPLSGLVSMVLGSLLIYAFMENKEEVQAGT